MSLVFSIGLGIQRQTEPATAAASPEPALFAFEILNEAGSATITNVPNLRISLNGGTLWTTLAAAGLTVARDGTDKLRVSGFADTATRDAALFHYEQQLPGEPNSAPSATAANLPALYFRRLGGPAPVNTTLPGMTVSATRVAAPIGVTA